MTTLTGIETGNYQKIKDGFDSSIGYLVEMGDIKAEVATSVLNRVYGTTMTCATCQGFDGLRLFVECEYVTMAGTQSVVVRKFNAKGVEVKR
jgi:hypothetical protein